MLLFILHHTDRKKLFSNNYMIAFAAGAILWSVSMPFEYIITGSETEAFILEMNLIKKHHPKYNIMLMDKTYKVHHF